MEQIRALQAQITLPQVELAIENAQAFPRSSSELIISASLAGVNSDSTALRALAAKEERHKQSWLSRMNRTLGTPVKGFVRGAFLAFDMLWEEGPARLFRTAVGTITGQGGYSEAGGSTALRALGELFGGERVNIGSGFLPSSTDPTSRPEFAKKALALRDQGHTEDAANRLAVQEINREFGLPVSQIAQAAQRQIQVNDMPVSFGRILADTFTDPGDTMYNIVSGAVDGAAQIFLDPANIIGVGLDIPFTAARIPGVRDVTQGRKIIFNDFVDEIPGMGTLDGFSEELGQLTSRVSAAEKLDPLNRVQARARGFKTVDEFQNASRTMPSAEFSAKAGYTQGQIRDYTRLQEMLGWTDAGPVDDAVRQFVPQAWDDVFPTLNDQSVRGLYGFHQSQRGLVDTTTAMKGASGRTRYAVGTENFLGSRRGRVWKQKVADIVSKEEWSTLHDFISKGGEDLNAEYFRDMIAFGASPEGVDNVLRKHVGMAHIREVPTAPLPSRLVGGAIGNLGGALGKEMGFAGGIRPAFRTIGAGMPGIRRKFSEMGGTYVSNEMGPTHLLSEMDKWLVSIGLSEGDHFITGADELARLGKAFPQQGPYRIRGRGHWLKEIAEINDFEDQSVLFGKVRRIVRDVGDKWISEGINRETVEAWTKIFDSPEELRKFFTTQVGEDAFVPGRGIGKNIKMIDNQGHVRFVPSAQLMSEMLNKGIPLPDPRQSRKILTHLGRLVDSGAFTIKGRNRVEDIIMATDGAMSRVWKPLTLLRGAWPMRVVGEEQVRMAGNGMFSLFNHPMQAINIAMGKKMTQDVLESPFEANRQFIESMSNDLGGSHLFNKPFGKIDTVWRDIDKSDPEYVNWFAREVQELSADELARRFAEDRGAAWRWITTDEGKTYLDDFFRRQGEESAAWGVGNAEAHEAWANAVEARVHIKTGGRYRLENTKMTGEERLVINGDGHVIRNPHEDEVRDLRYVWESDGDVQLLEAIGTGRLGIPGYTTVNLPHMRQTQEWSDFKRALQTWVDRGVGPTTVKGADTTITKAHTTGWDDFVDKAFSVLMGTTTDKLSRAPAFKQFYWQRIGELVPMMDETTRAATLAAAEKAKLPAKLIKQINRSANAQTLGKTGTLTSLEDVDMVAKAFGLTSTKQLLYDLGKRHEWSDSMRNVAPFAEAWWEILSTWSRLLLENPVGLPRRFQQTMEGAREGGFFQYDEQLGEEVFVYPGGGILADWLLDVNPAGPPGTDPLLAGIGAEGPGEGAKRDPASIRLAAPVASLNLFSQSILPGFGPAVQIPASHFIPDRPEWDEVMEVLSPFGRTKIKTPGDLANTFLPAWSKKFLTGLNEDKGEWSRVYNNSVMDVYKMMVINGGDTSTPEAQLALLDKAKRDAKKLSIFRGAMQFFAPASPIPKYEVEDKDGNWWQFNALAEEYWDKWRNVYGGDHFETTRWFVSAYGADPSLFTTSKTVSVQRRAVTEGGINFERQNRELFKEFPNTAYYAMPDNPSDEFDYFAYLRQLENGTRVPLSPEQWQSAANHFKASIRYEKARDDIDPRIVDDDPARQYLRSTRLWLMENYPGYNPEGRDFIGVPSRATTTQMLIELEKWESNPSLRDSSTGRGLAQYLEARKVAMVEANNRGLASFATADSAKDLRQWLRGWGEYLSNQEESRDFGPLWSFVLSRELRNDAGVGQEAA